MTFAVLVNFAAEAVEYRLGAVGRLFRLGVHGDDGAAARHGLGVVARVLVVAAEESREEVAYLVAEALVVAEGLLAALAALVARVVARGDADVLARDSALHQLDRGALRLAVVVEQTYNRLSHSLPPFSYE